MADKRKRASDKVANGIRGLIDSNGMKPGEMLPSIDRLSEMFHVARGTVREALQNLAAAGIVEMH